jgi:leucyl aminopeptidase
MQGKRMQLNIKNAPVQKQQKACLLVGVYANGELSKTAAELDKLNKGEIRNFIKKSAFGAVVGKFVPIFHLSRTSVPVILIGCGKKSEMTIAHFNKVAAAHARALLDYKIERAVSYLCEITVEKKELRWKVRQLAEVVLASEYVFDRYKKDKQPKPVLKELSFHLTQEEKVCTKVLHQVQALTLGMTLAKDLANTPSNICTPTYLAEAAKQLAKQYKKISVQVLDEKAMRKLGMGAMLAVSQGSEQPAKLICLQYQAGPKAQKPVALVGKGITFDTGGNSLKPADSMVGMKYDMCGAATVLGTLKACAELKLATNVVGVIAAVENMPGGSAYKPEDILTSMQGTTIEVISTDAEGRLVLADALTYCARYKPETVIDIATLTGAVVIALGFHASGLVANDQALADALLKAGTESNDRAWQLPLWDEYQEQIKSPFADIANTGGRAAGTITAGCFLSRFAKNYRWAHLDVAGTAAMMMGSEGRKATGRPIPLLMQYLINRVERHDKR